MRRTLLRHLRSLLAGSACLLVLLSPASANGLDQSTAEIARQSVNPLGGDFIVWFNFTEFDMLHGELTDKARYSVTNLLQPVIPFPLPKLGEDWVIVNRPTIGYNFYSESPQGPKYPGTKSDVQFFDDERGMADIEYFSLIGTSTYQTEGWAVDAFGEGDRVLAAGITTHWPTGKSSLPGNWNAYAAGPAFTAGFLGKKWILITLVQHWWHYEKEKNGPGEGDINNTRIQVIYYRQVGESWQVGGSPIGTIDWTRDSSNRYSIPVGLGAIKTFFIGKTPIKMGLDIRPFIFKGDELSNEWNIELIVIPITPNFFQSKK